MRLRLPLPRPGAWTVRRADDFPPAAGGGGNRALCCTTTCCAVFVGAAAGIVAGGVTGIVTGVKSVRRRRREGLPPTTMLPMPAFVALTAALYVLPLYPLLELAALAVPVLAGAIAWAVGRGSPRAAAATAAVARVMLHIAAWTAAGVLVGGGVGLAIDGLL